MVMIAQRASVSYRTVMTMLLVSEAELRELGI